MEGAVTISGPGLERTAPTFGAGLAYAMQQAGRAERGTFYVRGQGHTGIVERHDDGSVTSVTRVSS